VQQNFCTLPLLGCDLSGRVACLPRMTAALECCLVRGGLVGVDWMVRGGLGGSWWVECMEGMRFEIKLPQTEWNTNPLK
jgi:hypothetical protein